eukprot:CAMPEP_0114989662 /NCGR_PEP_ID=MMETSP0216-20121206/10326_1 /TAXON_ID=223996 /ORGANISM="Protocruzia adherens, Strain Boccale" /LENGTH=782 /DNA_ID=CAMNT_0002352673 /DNA_START=95 /DNA_END=2443 /DNA_ORIENTATION=-
MGNAETRPEVADHINKLKLETIDIDDDEYFNALFDFPRTEDDVYDLFTQMDVKVLKEKRPHNLTILIWKIIQCLRRFAYTPLLINPTNNSRATNCIIIMTRMMPILLDNSNGDDFARHVFWLNEKPPMTPKNVESGTDGPESSSLENISKSETANGAGVPYAAQLVDALFKMLFYPGFTVYPHSGSVTTVDFYDFDPSFCWYAGAMVKKLDSPEAISDMFWARYHIKKCLVACFSGDLLVNPKNVVQSFNPWIWLATSRYTKNVTTLFWSLINAVCRYEPDSSMLPYMSYMTSHEEYDRFTDLAAHLLCLLMDFKLPPTEVISECLQNSVIHQKAAVSIRYFKLEMESILHKSNDEENEEEEKKAEEDDNQDGTGSDEGIGSTIVYSNKFTEVISEIRSKTDCLHIYDSLTNILQNLVDCNNTYLPGSMKQIECHKEILYILWCLVHKSEAFMFNLQYHGNPLKLFKPLIYLMLDSYDDPSKISVFYFTSFVFLHLSSEREFCVSLNEPYENDLPVDLPLFNGTYGDLVFIAFHKIIIGNEEKIHTVLNGLLTILANISPYMMSITLVAAVKMVSMFEYFIARKWLLSKEDSYVPALHLLEVFVYMIHYQYAGSTNLVYAILRRKSLFEQLRSFSVEAAPISANSALNSGQDKEEESKEIVQSRYWVPTNEWVESWKSQLKLESVQRLIHNLFPRVEAHCVKNDIDDEEPILAFLKRTTMVGLLPLPPQIVIRKFHYGIETQNWFIGYLWRLVFLKNQKSGLFDNEAIKLFTVSIVRADPSE